MFFTKMNAVVMPYLIWQFWRSRVNDNVNKNITQLRAFLILHDQFDIKDENFEKKSWEEIRLVLKNCVPFKIANTLRNFGHFEDIQFVFLNILSSHILLLRA